MFGKVTPEKAMIFTKRCITLAYCWPLSATATKFQLLRFKILRLATILSGVLLFLPLLYATYLHRDNAIAATRAACLSFPVFQIIVQTSYLMTQYDRLQWLIERMVAYCQTAKSYERFVFQQYLDRYSTFYGMSAMWFYGTAFVVVVATLFISQPFPTNAEYPFPTDYEPVRTIIFLHQALVGMQCAAQVSVSVLGALLMLFAAARFEILATELRAVKSVHGLVQCVKKYYNIRRYAQEVVSVVRYISLIAIACSILSLILFGIFLIGRQPLAVKLQYVFLSGTALVEVFMCAWPADNLMDVVSSGCIQFLCTVSVVVSLNDLFRCCQSANAMAAVYESTWYNRTLEMQKNVLYMLLPQKPVAITFKCVVPVLSLEYYCSFVSNAFSMFTALRVMISDEDERRIHLPKLTMSKVTPEEVIEFMRKSVVSGLVWPLPSTASTRRTLTFKILQGCTIINSTLFLLPLLGAAYANRHDTAVLTRCIVVSIATFQFGFQAGISLIWYENIQHIIEEMIACIKDASALEREVFQKYVDQCRILYGSAVVWFYMCIGTYVFCPLVLPQPLPMEGEYPFDTEPLLAWAIVYFHQSLCGLQCAAAMSHCAFGALLLWFSAARFECLILELKATSNTPMLIKCIKKQMRLRRYAREVVSCFRSSVICAIIVSTIAVTLCCVGMLVKQPMIGKVQNMFVFFTILLEIFMYAWPADHMKNMSMFVPQGVYESEWYNHALSMQKDIVCMLTYQEPVTVSVSGIMPELTLRYYCTYLSNAFSIFTTMRIMLDVD
ncbi:uncharacterized protein LOC143376583 [Andrena cerasifolii]|uniref:uncharacterized protein LOC143376583 n=1 Tax=Andrena cerasifolii TaxID=2819439 RepID=UPI004037EC90